MIFKQAAPPEIAKHVIGLYFVAGVLMPVLRISNAHIKSIEFFQGFSFGGRGHPWERFNALAESGGDVGDHLLRLGFGFRREETLRINFPDGVTQPADRKS